MGMFCTSAIMFADIAGSTALYERIGDRAALDRIGTCLDRLAVATKAVGGRVVKTIGDEVMCSFNQASDAIRAATEMQLGQEAAVDGLGLKIGFHFGEVILRDGDVFGDTVNVAARVAGLAKAGQILATEPSLRQLPPYLRSAVRAMGPIVVRGKEQPLAVCEIIWSWAENMTMMDDARHGDDSPGAGRLVVEYGTVTREFTGSDGVLSFGRAVGNSLVVDCPKASRMHARIEVRQSGFVLVDLSSNGTYIRSLSGVEIVLRREEALLQGEGAIGLGAPVPESGAGAVRFRSA